MNEKQFHEIIKNIYIFILVFSLAAGLKESLLMLLNVGAEKMGNERKSNTGIIFLCFYIINYFNGKMPSHVFSTSSIYNIKIRRNVVKKQSVRNVAQDYRDE